MADILEGCVMLVAMAAEYRLVVVQCGDSAVIVLPTRESGGSRRSKRQR